MKRKHLKKNKKLLIVVLKSKAIKGKQLHTRKRN